MGSPSILIITPDTYLASIYARKFEIDNWEVETAATIDEGIKLATRSRPDIIIIDCDCADDISLDVKRLKVLPTLLKTKIVALATEADREEIKKAFAAGITSYLIQGHFVPQEAVQKMRKIWQS